EMRGGRDRDAGLRRAASEHDLEPELVRAIDHRAGLGDAAALLQLHVDAVARLSEAIDVGYPYRRVVGHDRQLAAFAEAAKPVDVLRRRRLLDELDVVSDDPAYPPRRLIRCPRRVGIDTDRAGKSLADATEDRIVIAMAELHLQYLEALRGRGRGAIGHHLRLGDTDGERCRRGFAARGRRAVRRPEQRKERPPSGMRGTVVAEDVEGARGGAAVRKALVETRPEPRQVRRV